MGGVLCCFSEEEKEGWQVSRQFENQDVVLQEKLGSVMQDIGTVMQNRMQNSAEEISSSTLQVASSYVAGPQSYNFAPADMRMKRPSISFPAKGLQPSQPMQPMPVPNNLTSKPPQPIPVTRMPMQVSKKMVEKLPTETVPETLVPTEASEREPVKVSSEMPVNVPSNKVVSSYVAGPQSYNFAPAAASSGGEDVRVHLRASGEVTPAVPTTAPGSPESDAGSESSLSDRMSSNGDVVSVRKVEQAKPQILLRCCPELRGQRRHRRPRGCMRHFDPQGDSESLCPARGRTASLGPKPPAKWKGRREQSASRTSGEADRWPPMLARFLREANSMSEDELKNLEQKAEVEI